MIRGIGVLIGICAFVYASVMVLCGIHAYDDMMVGGAVLMIVSAYA